VAKGEEVTKRRHYIVPLAPDIFGAWVPLLALTASKTLPIEQAKREIIFARLERAYTDLASAPEPTRASWRDLADAMNFLQTLVELGWGEDPQGAIEDIKGALFTAAKNLERTGKLRLDGTNLARLRDCIDHLAELLPQLSAHSYWVAVSHTKSRISKLLRGKRRAGDVVITV
jgi:hypothetical protein